MYSRSALPGVLFTVSAFLCAGCTHQLPPDHGAAIVHSEEIDNKPLLVEVPVDGQYACYREGFADPLGTYTLTKGQMIGFELHQAPQPRGGYEPVLVAVAGKDRFILPIGDKYVWKKV